MKLYTEEQVRKIYNDANIDICIDNLTPIELPSDEEIEESANIYAVSKRQLKNLSNKEFDFSRNDFIKASKWMKEQILNQNK